MSANHQEKNLELSGQIRSHVQFENQDFISILSNCTLPNQRCVKCVDLNCQGKDHEQTKKGCPGFQPRA